MISVGSGHVRAGERLGAQHAQALEDAQRAAGAWATLTLPPIVDLFTHCKQGLNCT